MVNEVADLLIKYGAIEFGDFTLTSGSRSSFYIDIKSASTNPFLLGSIGRIIAERYNFDVVAGVAVGAVPIAVAVSLSAGKPYAIIRKEKKDYGKGGTIIGDVGGKDVLLVEDVSTSGGSVLYGVECLRNAGAHVERVVTVVDREQGAVETLKEKGIELCALVSVSEIMNR